MSRSRAPAPHEPPAQTAGFAPQPDTHTPAIADPSSGLRSDDQIWIALAPRVEHVAPPAQSETPSQPRVGDPAPSRNNLWGLVDANGALQLPEAWAAPPPRAQLATHPPVSEHARTGSTAGTGGNAGSAPLPARTRRRGGRHKRTSTTGLQGTSPRRRRRARPVTLVVLVLASTAALVGAAIAFTLLPDPERRPSDSQLLAAAPLTAEALSWLEQNTTPGTEILVPRYLQRNLAGLLTPRSVKTYASAPSSAADLIVVAPTVAQETSVRLKRLLAQSEPVAVFGDGAQVRHVLRDSSPRRLQAERRRAGRVLLSDSSIRLAPHAWAILAAGEVDPRLMSLLAHLSDNHTIDVSGFPRSGPERGARAPAREMQVIAFDGKVIGAGGIAASQLRSMLLALPEPLRPAEVRLPEPSSPGKMLVRFLLPAPDGRVPPAAPSNNGTP